LIIKTRVKRFLTGFGLGLRNVGRQSSLNAKPCARGAILKNHRGKGKDLLTMGPIVLMRADADAQPAVKLSRNICSVGGSQF